MSYPPAYLKTVRKSASEISHVCQSKLHKPPLSPLPSICISLPLFPLHPLSHLINPTQRGDLRERCFGLHPSLSDLPLEHDGVASVTQSLPEGQGQGRAVGRHAQAGLNGDGGGVATHGCGVWVGGWVGLEVGGVSGCKDHRETRKTRRRKGSSNKAMK